LSKQFLQNFVDRENNKARPLSDLPLKKADVIFIDEAHFHEQTDLGVECANLFKKKNTVFVYMTATPLKVIRRENIDIPPQCVLSWDLVDEELARETLDLLQ
jgi:hypothetical protein